MASTQDTLYQGLKEDLLLGPDHHRFKLIKKAAEHPLGQLWQAEDVGVAGNPIVTLLIIKPSLLKHKDFVEGVKKHATLNKQLQNKHIAECYGFFAQKDGLLFLSYEKLDGLTLEGLIKKGNNLQEKQQRGLLRQIAYATDIGFQKLHSPHAGLEPSAVFINRKGGIKLTRFSLRESLDLINELLDEPFRFKAYQAPEAFRPGKLTRKADIYAFAAITYELLTGKPPFKVEDTESERVRKVLDKPNCMDEDQWKIFERAFSTDADERFANCTELLAEVFPDKPDNEEEKQPEKSENAEDKGAKDAAEAEVSTEEKPSLKDKLKRLVPKPPKLSKTSAYILSGLSIFVLGYLAGWFLSEFLNFKEKDFQELQIAKQQEALQQMYSSLQAQQELHKKRGNELKGKDLDINILQQELAAAQQLIKGAEPEQPGNQVFKDQIDEKAYGPEMVLLPSGDFRMGDQSGLGDDNEKPVHVVHIDKPFSISRYEITFAEYDLFAKSTRRPLPDDNGWGRGNQPVINVTWKDADAYAEWLSSQTGQPYRLPTEAEWEYAARAGTLSPYWWGNELIQGMAACSGCGSDWDGKQPAPVGSFQANPWGIHDMTGNVDEWVADCYSENYALAPIDGSAFTERACKNRTMRGGSWFEIDRLIRPASRYRHPADSKRNSWGFRIALDMSK